MTRTGRRPGRQAKLIIRRKKVPYLQSKIPRPVAEASEFLTKSVHGMKASDLEERFAKALDRYEIGYTFRLTTLPRGLPGFKELDFLVFSQRGTMGVSVEDTTFIHFGTDAKDSLQQAIVIDALRKQGQDLTPLAFPTPGNIIGVVSQVELGTQNLADRFVKENIL